MKIGTAKFIIGLAIISCIFSTQTFSQKPMNVLLLMIDDLRPQIFNANIDHYNTQLMATPHLDQLAESGVKFDRAYVQIPVCGASRLSIMTGARPFKTKGQDYGRFWDYNDELDLESPTGAPAGTNHPLDKEGNPALTLPGIFKQNGYNTKSIGKIYHKNQNDLDSWTHGMIPKTGNVYAIATEKLAYEIGEGMDDTSYADGITRNNGLEALRTLSQEENPFFLALGFVKPHLPFSAPKKYWDMYDRNKIQLPDNLTIPEGAPGESIHRFYELRGYDNIPYSDASENVIEEEFARTLIHGYYACVSYADAMVGSILEELDKLNIRENTIVVMIGDHGYNLNEHRMWVKHCLYETSIRTPFYIDVPGMQGNLSSQALVEFVDIYPTLCELTGIPLPDHLEGTSLVNLLKNPQANWKGAAFTNWRRGMSVRTDRYRYSEFVGVDDSFISRMLYDHKNDPKETINISEQSDNAALVNTLSTLLNDGWQRAAEGENNDPIGFTISTDGSINEVVNTQKPVAQNDVAISLWMDGGIVNNGTSLSLNKRTSLSMELKGLENASHVSLSIVKANGKRNRMYLKETNKNKSFTWSSPEPGQYFYQVKYEIGGTQSQSSTGKIILRQ